MSTLCIRVNVSKLNAEGKTAYALATDPEAKNALRSWMKGELNEQDTTNEALDYDQSDEDSS